MTRYARAGKGTHQRVAKDPTPWNEMKPSEPHRVRGKDDGGGGNKRFPNKNRRKERFSKGKPVSSGEKSSTDPANNKAGRNPSGESGEASGQNAHRDGSSKKSNNANIRGFGQSKSVKILGQFWVPLEDGKRLKNLLKKLKSQGLPRKEILEALKNERRKAEKASKRQRDKTCFQCRQFGHVLSDCPNLRKAFTGSGESLNGGNEEEYAEGLGEQGLVCFKCGSTEHTSRNCKRKGENFEFAKCFICSGSGHIARQCPKNSNGIYPSGGSCSECGLTTHLKKDCPDLFGIDISAKGDDDAVTLRVSDPFLSTEYEPVIDLDIEKVKDQNNDEVSPNISRIQSVLMQKAMPKQKEKRKNNLDDSDKSVALDVESDNINACPAVIKTLFASKKRKIVKF